MPQGLNASMIANKILYAGQPNYQELEVETQDTIAPGRLLIKGTDQWQCKIATAASTEVIGVADIMPDWKLTLMQTEIATGVPIDYYDANDQIRVIRGDVVVKLMAKSGEAINVGTKVVAAANGMIAAGTTAGQVVGYSLEKAQTRIATVCKWVLVKLTI